jgi:hypothetical protein
VSYTLTLTRVDPFGKRELGRCFACGEALTWQDERLVHVSVRPKRMARFHRDCFEHFRAGLNLFAEQVLLGNPAPELAN